MFSYEKRKTTRKRGSFLIIKIIYITRELYNPIKQIHSLFYRLNSGAAPRKTCYTQQHTGKDWQIKRFPNSSRWDT